MNRDVSECRICGEPAEKRVGAYAFCGRHFERATRQRRSPWRTAALAVGILVALVVVAFVVDRAALQGSSGRVLPALGILLALAPGLVWLALFYRQDHLEPEPMRLVASVFVLSALLALAVGIPLLRDVFAVQEWMSGGLFVQLAGGFLVVGFVQEALKYAAVRFSVYETDEFDEPTDGVVYGTAAGLGFATVLNLAVLGESGEVGLGLASIHAVLIALAHGSFGGVVGYFLSGQKLEARPAWWSALGIAAAALLNSVFSTARVFVVSGNASIAGVPLGPWLGLLVAAVLAAVIATALYRLIRREVARAERATDIA